MRSIARDGTVGIYGHIGEGLTQGQIGYLGRSGQILVSPREIAHSRSRLSGRKMG